MPEAKSIVEYVVLERHVALREKSTWKICGKVTPCLFILSTFFCLVESLHATSPVTAIAICSDPCFCFCTDSAYL